MSTEKLKNIKQLVQKTKKLEKKIEEYNELIILYNNTNGKESYNFDIEEIKNSLEKLIAKLEKHKIEIIKLKADFSKYDFSDNENNIIMLRYFEGLSWNEIEARTSYSLSNCFTIHRKCIKKFAEF